MEPLNSSCPGFTRRTLLGWAGASGLSFLLPPLDARAARARGPERAKSLIMLWMAGGPSQLETWDPHPGTLIGGDSRSIDTRLRGLRIADGFPKMAEQIQHLSVIRSLVSKEGDHERGTYYLKTGYRPDPTLRHPALGAILTRQLPVKGLEIPQHVSLCQSEWPARGGFLGDSLDAFKVYDPGAGLRNISSIASDNRSRLTRRLSAVDKINRTGRAGRMSQVGKTLHEETVTRALVMMRSEQRRAFEIEHESKATRAAYGETAFGRGCLVARRLVEQGVRAVEVTLGGFDSHARNHEIHRRNAAILDPAFAALVQDLVERDLLASTIVLCIGEFGRTPRINPLAGRDHWPSGFSCVVGGGGLRAGLVLGETDPEGEQKDPRDPIEVFDLYATLLRTMGVDVNHEFQTPIGRPMKISSGKPLARLLG